MKIGILAFGETGSMIAEQAAAKGFSVIAINTAKIDFEKIKAVPKDCRIHLEGWEGAGGNREEGKIATISSAGIIIEKVQQKLGDCDFIFVAGSGSGGTGSGGLPIGTEILSEIKEFVGIITTFPELSEAPKAQMNALECFSEVSKFEQLGSIFIIDNEESKVNLPNCNRKERYIRSNSDFIETLAEIASLTKQKSYVSNFDRNDLLQILNERGCSIVSKVIVPADQINSEADLTKIIHESWQKNVHPKANQAVRAAILGKIPEHITTYINLEAIFSNIGMPYDVMESYYSNEGNENHCIFYTILSGTTFPNERLEQMATISKEAETNIAKHIETARSQQFDAGNNWTSKFNRIKKGPQQNESLKERLAKFK